MRHIPVTGHATRFRPQGRKRARYEMNTRFAGAPGYVPSAGPRAHVVELHQLGMPLASIARDAGCALSFVSKLHGGTRETCRIRQATAIMAVTCHPNERQQVVLNIGAVRRLQALHAIGQSWRSIAEDTPGVTDAVMSQMVRGKDNRYLTSWATWAAIRDTYERRSGTPGPPSRATTLARKTAAAKGWPAPLDWEGHDIDDPRVTVVARPWQPPTFQDLIAERRELVAELTGKGMSAAEIADHLGVDERTVVRDRGTIAAA